MSLEMVGIAASVSLGVLAALFGLFMVAEAVYHRAPDLMFLALFMVICGAVAIAAPLAG